MPREPKDYRLAQSDAELASLSNTELPVQSDTKLAAQSDAELEWLLCLAAGLQNRQQHLAKVAAEQSPPLPAFLKELQDLLTRVKDSNDAPDD